MLKKDKQLKQCLIKLRKRMIISVPLLKKKKILLFLNKISFVFIHLIFAKYKKRYIYINVCLLWFQDTLSLVVRIEKYTFQNNQ